MPQSSPLAPLSGYGSNRTGTDGRNRSPSPRLSLPAMAPSFCRRGAGGGGRSGSGPPRYAPRPPERGEPPLLRELQHPRGEPPPLPRRRGAWGGGAAGRGARAGGAPALGGAAPGGGRGGEPPRPPARAHGAPRGALFAPPAGTCPGRPATSGMICGQSAPLAAPPL